MYLKIEHFLDFSKDKDFCLENDYSPALGQCWVGSLRIVRDRNWLSPVIVFLLALLINTFSGVVSGVNLPAGITFSFEMIRNTW